MRRKNLQQRMVFIGIWQRHSFRQQAGNCKKQLTSPLFRHKIKKDSEHAIAETDNEGKKKMSFLERKNTKDGMAAGQKASVDNIYALDGKVPVLNAIPFGLQHILAMFVANIAPILIVAGACGMDAKNTAMIIQSAMMIAGIGTLIQLFPIWRIGSRLPIVMGISFTFVSIACVIGGQYGYGAIMGAVLVGGIVEGVLGLLSKYWMKLVTPIVAATVVTAIGFSLLEVGADSFGVAAAVQISDLQPTGYLEL